MSRVTKKRKLAESKLEAGKSYTLREASALVKEITLTKFDASVDIDVRLGIDPRKSNQMVRGVVSLPHGTGKETKVLALCTPDKEAEAKAAGARVVSTGRSDFPNQVNNVLCFPGIFRGALDVRASEINDEMKIAAAKAIAGLVSDEELNEEYILPKAFDSRVKGAVATATAEAAKKTGVTRM